jgi:ribosome maturation factor RimP
MLSREEIAELAASVLKEQQMELVELQIQHGNRLVLRFFIDGPQGVDVGHCAVISRGIERKLEAMDPDAKTYVLEVSSAGMNRQIWLAAHFERFSGEQVTVTFRDERDGLKKIDGVIEAVDGDTITVLMADGNMIEFAAADIEKARLDIDPWQGSRADKK